MSDCWIPSDDLGLKDRVAIIAGGGAAGDGIGNGRAAAILLARSGTRVLVVDREGALAERTAEMCREHGSEAASTAADVTDDAACRRMVDATLERFGRVDFLVNNVGILSRGNVVEEPQADFERVMRINVESMFLASKHTIPAMRQTAGGGAIVNIASISALRPRGLTSYATSKGAVIALTRAMAVDHGPDGIRVNCIAPGPVYTPLVYAAHEGGMPTAARERRRMSSVMGREGTGWDVGNAVRYLLSDHARYVTGHTLVVDGGATLVGPARHYR